MKLPAIPCLAPTTSCAQASRVKYYLLPPFALLAASCGSHDPGRADTTRVTPADPTHATTDTLAGRAPVPAAWQPEAFLDSLGRLPAAPLVARATRYVDSVFTHQPMQSRLIGPADLRLLKRTRQTGFLSVQAARHILGDTSISVRSNSVAADPAAEQGSVQVRYLAFGADEYALDVGVSGHAGAAMYFFKGNKLLARHETPYIYGQSLRYYRDAEGHAVVYYLYAFERGSGIWWNQYFFYRYEGEQLVPVLTELQNGNLRQGWGERAYWLEATVQHTNPLTLKMVYNVELPDTARTAPYLLNDSTLVRYRWNRPAHRLQGQYQRASLTRPQVLSYYVQRNDLLFGNAYYARLKQALADPAERPAARRYLWAVRQHYGRPQPVPSSHR